jgi:hypothetical protein
MSSRLTLPFNALRALVGLGAPQGYVQDPNFPVAPHVTELRALLAGVIPDGVIYGKALSPSEGPDAREINIGLYPWNIAEPGTQGSRTSAFLQEHPLRELDDYRDRLTMLQDLMPGIEWQAEPKRICVDRGPKNIDSFCEGTWTDSSGTAYRIRVDLSEGGGEGFVQGASVETSAAMNIGTGRVTRHAKMTIPSVKHTEQLEAAASALALTYA